MADPSPRTAHRLRGIEPTIFGEMSALAVRTGALNLGQGFPDVDGPAAVVEAAVEAMRAGRNQYAPGPGAPELREAVVAHQRRHYGLELDPLSEVVVTAGATEAIAAALLALVDPVSHQGCAARRLAGTCGHQGQRQFSEQSHAT
jgi:N-succinyldiaminopimelate aminotransferase